MTTQSRTVADRQKSLQPESPDPNVSLFGLQLMYSGLGGEEFKCTISEYCRTRVFEFPRSKVHPAGNEPHHEIYVSPTVQGTVTPNLVEFFKSSTFSRHYNINPSLRFKVGETKSELSSQQVGHVPVFLIIEEVCQLVPVEMTDGECSLVDEVVVRDDEEVPYLIGGRKGEKFIVAQAATDGAWPDLPDNQLLVNVVLAGVRVGQQAAGPIRKWLDHECLVTDDGRFVSILGRLSGKARVSLSTKLDSTAYRDRVSEIRKAISAMELDTSVPHLALLFNAIYRDECGDDDNQRLRYLQLWQSLSEAAPRWLKYQGDIRTDNVVVAGQKTIRELRDYRDDIAHWWTDNIDEAYFADLQMTINELIRRKYF